MGFKVGDPCIACRKRITPPKRKPVSGKFFGHASIGDWLQGDEPVRDEQADPVESPFKIAAE